MATIDNARSRYSTVAIGLHWLIGLAVIVLIFWKVIPQIGSYQDALTAWFNPKYLPLMDEKGREAWPRVKALLAA